MPYKDRKGVKARASDKRYNHSDKGKARYSKYNHSEKGKMNYKRYNQSSKGRLRTRKYYFNHEPITVVDIYKMILKGY